MFDWLSVALYVLPFYWKTRYVSLLGTKESTAAPPLVTTFTIIYYDFVFFTPLATSFLSSVAGTPLLGAFFAAGSSFFGDTVFLGSEILAFFGGRSTFCGVTDFFGSGAFCFVVLVGGGIVALGTEAGLESAGFGLVLSALVLEADGLSSFFLVYILANLALVFGGISYLYNNDYSRFSIIYF